MAKDRLFTLGFCYILAANFLLFFCFLLVVARFAFLFKGGISNGEICDWLYFTFMAVGLAVSRIFSGRQVDKGRITRVISLGMYLAAFSFLALALCRRLMAWNPVVTSDLFLGIALVQGVAFGTMFPAFNTLFVNLASPNQRGTATSTYLTSWDFGIGIGLMAGGTIAEGLGGFNYAYLLGAGLTVVSSIYFLFIAGPHFNRNKLR